MCRKILWFYIFVLTLLDISLNTKLSAQGKSHGVTVHDSLIEGITFQEWGKEPESGGRRVASDALLLSPPALEFGRAALAAAHTLTVTLTNTANTTMHLASVAGTTPDFHASFFHSKTLPPQANTTFSVVYLGRREGPVAAHLYIHTSLGVHKYPVSAVGVASEWGVWPLVGLRVPLNATAEPLLTMYNPTDQTIQVSEVYSSGAWLGLRLPGGGSAAPRGLWLLPPRAERPLVRLRLTPPHDAAHALTAYIRIKANMTGGGLVVCVEARGAPPGEFLSPWHLRLRTSGSADPPLRMVLEAGNSLGAGVALDASVWARCAADPPAPPAPGPADQGTANGNGAAPEGGGGGVSVSLLRTHLEPHQEPARAALLTLDYGRMWAGREAGADGAWCAGWVRVGRAHLPYSVRLLPGTLRLLPAELHVVSGHREEALKVQEVRVRNEFRVPVHITHVELPPDIDEHFESEWWAPLALGAGAEAALGRLRLRAAAGAPALRSRIVLHTNLTSYELFVLVYDARLNLEWEWPNSADGELRLGGVGASSTRHVALRVHNPAPAPLCAAELRAELAGAHLALEACAHLRHVPADHACRCVEAGASALAWLTVVAPAREGPLSGAVWTRTRAPRAPPLAAAPALRTPVSLHVLRGRLHALPLLMPRVAPYAWSSASLVLESTMAVRMRVVNVSLAAPDPAVIYVPAGAGGGEVSAGRQAVGTVVYAAEKLCEPHCYTGLDLDSPEGVSWVRRGADVSAEGLRADAALHAERFARYTRHAQRAANISLHVHTTQVVQVGVRGAADWWWVRLAAGGGDAGLCAVGAARAWRLRAANPASAHALLLQPVVAAHALHLAGAERSERCAARERCAWSAEAFRVAEWRAARGAVRQWEGARANASAADAPLLLLAPGAEVELKLVFAPKDALPFTAYLYLRNNLTIIEGVQLFGRGAHPSFEIAGRRPNTNSPLLFEVEGCATGDGTVRRTVVARNTGAVGVRLREWRVAGQPCQARGFRVRPCAPLHLAPNESRALTFAYAPDYSLARAAAPLQLLTDSGAAAFRLRASAPARLLPRCAAAQPRPPWEPALRAAGTILALAALALVLAAATLDAERELRRARARPPPAPRQPLDLRALARVPPVAPAPPRRVAPRRKRATRRVLPALDPHAERHAFERWRARVMRPDDDDDSRSSEDADRDGHVAHALPARTDTDPDVDAPPPNATAADTSVELPLVVDGYEADRETEDRPPGGGEDDAASTGSGTASASSSSSPTVDRDEVEPDVDEHEADQDADTSPDNDAPPESAHRHEVVVPVADGAVREPRPRRDAGDTPRRSECARPEAGEGARAARCAPAKHHTRKDKLSKRRTERPPASPTRSPARAACSPGEAGGAGVRWGASWSSVVAARGALAPIGSSVRRREPGPRTDHSLFYFNGDAAQVAAPAPAPAHDYWCAPAPLDATAFTPARDFTEEPSGGAAYRPLGSVWGGPAAGAGADAAWRWGGAGEVRPPPGFGGARPARVYDPFRSLAAIWAPGARDWRADPPPAADE